MFPDVNIFNIFASISFVSMKKKLTYFELRAMRDGEAKALKM